MLENIRISFQGIWGHKMRSLLTMLGIIIGIAAIIAIVSTIKGTNEQIKENLIGSGDNTLKITTQQNGYEVSPSDGLDMSGVPIYDASKLEELTALDSVTDACMYHFRMMYQGVYFRNTDIQGVMLVGSDARYLSINGYRIVEGRGFVPEDQTRFRNVVILDRKTVLSMFEGESAVGQTVEVSGIPFTVIGVMEKEDDGFEPVVNNLDDYLTYYQTENQSVMVVPDSVWPVVSSFDEPYQFIVKAKDTESMSTAAKEAEDLLNAGIRSRGSSVTGMDSGLDDGLSEKEADMLGLEEGVSGLESNQIKYKSEDTLEKAKELQKLANATKSQLIWIAGISLLVGGIGVMNIMLVSVTERTREIGLKKALGARRRMILGQFLTEASVLTSLGGIIGVGAGIGLAYFIGKLAEVPVAVSGWAIVISVVFSMVIGILFGLIPSIKASKLDPIEALRYE